MGLFRRVRKFFGKFSCCSKKKTDVIEKCHYENVEDDENRHKPTNQEQTEGVKPETILRHSEEIEVISILVKVKISSDLPQKIIKQQTEVFRPNEGKVSALEKERISINGFPQKVVTGSLTQNGEVLPNKTQCLAESGSKQKTTHGRKRQTGRKRPSKSQKSFHTIKSFFLHTNTKLRCLFKRFEIGMYGVSRNIAKEDVEEGYLYVKKGPTEFELETGSVIGLFAP